MESFKRAFAALAHIVHCLSCSRSLNDDDMGLNRDIDSCRWLHMEGREGQRLGKCLGAAIFTCRPFHHSLRKGSCGKYGLLLLSARLICQTHNSINFLQPEMRKQTTPVQETILGSILYISLPIPKCILYNRSLFLTIQQGIHSLRKYVLNVQ